MVKASGTSAVINPRPDITTISPDVVTTNPLATLLPEDRLRALASLDDSQRQIFYGRVLESVFSNPAYQQVVFETAATEFDKLAGPTPAQGDELQSAIESAVRKVLDERGIR